MTKYYVTDFGAVPDGVTDCQDAFATATTAADGRDSHVNNAQQVGEAARDLDPPTRRLVAFCRENDITLRWCPCCESECLTDGHGDSMCCNASTEPLA